ncbi:hypothetical protein YC2023_106981 [Brassica napus]
MIGSPSSISRKVFQTRIRQCVLFFAFAVTPLHHLTVTSSRHHTITSVQARCHRITSPLLKLTVTPSPHACNSSSSFQFGEE